MRLIYLLAILPDSCRVHNDWSIPRAILHYFLYRPYNKYNCLFYTSALFHYNLLVNHEKCGSNKSLGVGLYDGQTDCEDHGLRHRASQRSEKYNWIVIYDLNSLPLSGYFLGLFLKKWIQDPNGNKKKHFLELLSAIGRLIFRNVLLNLKLLKLNKHINTYKIMFCFRRHCPKRAWIPHDMPYVCASSIFK